MKKKWCFLLVICLTLSMLFYTVPAMAATVSAPTINSVTLKDVSGKCELTVKWAKVTNANDGYEISIFDSNQKLVSGVCTSNTSYTAKVLNDNYTVKIRAVNKSWYGSRTKSSYSSKTVKMLKPTISISQRFFALQPGVVQKLPIKITPESKVSYTVGNTSVANVDSSGTLKTKSHGTTTITIKSGECTQIVSLYVSYSTGQIKSINSSYGFASNVYWSYSPSTGSSSSYKASKYKARTASSDSSNKPGDQDYVGYRFDDAAECMGFAHFIGSKLSGKSPRNWSKFTTIQKVKEAGGLQVGDIIRANGHSAIVYTVSSNGSFTVTEAWGTSNNIIKVAVGFGGRYSTLSSIPGFSYVLRNP